MTSLVGGSIIEKCGGESREVGMRSPSGVASTSSTLSLRLGRIRAGSLLLSCLKRDRPELLPAFEGGGLEPSSASGCWSLDLGCLGIKRGFFLVLLSIITRGVDNG
jgi:hypothetical protein